MEQEIRLRFTPSFYRRQGFVGGLIAILSLPIPYFMRHAGLLAWVMPVMGIGVWLFVVLREMRIAARLLDEIGVTRGDGRRYLWKDLRDVQEVRWILRNGQQGGVNHVDLHFAQGRARILFQVLENGIEAIQFARCKEAAMNRPPPPAPSPKPEKCPGCGHLGNYHLGMQKHGREAEDTFLPNMGRLKTIREVRHPQDGRGDLEQCMDCGAWFFYRNEYEYLATGSEDTQTLTRITAEEAERLPTRPPNE